MVTTCGAAVPCHRRDTIIIARRLGIGRRPIGIDVCRRASPRRSCETWHQGFSCRAFPVAKIQIAFGSLLNTYPVKAARSLSTCSVRFQPNREKPDPPLSQAAKSEPLRFANLHRYPLHLHPGLPDAETMRLSTTLGSAESHASTPLQVVASKRIQSQAFNVRALKAWPFVRD